MKKTLSLILVFVMLLGLLSGCGSPKHDPITDEEQIFSILEKYDFWFYSDCGENVWYGTTTDNERVEYAGELKSMLSALGYDLSKYKADSDFAKALNDYYDKDKSLSIFASACAVLGIDGSRYAAIYDSRSAEELDTSLAGEWDNDTTSTSLVFDEYGSVVVSNYDDSKSYSYEYDGETLYLYLYSDTMTGHLDEAGDLIIDTEDGYYYRVDEAYYVPGGDAGEAPGDIGGGAPGGENQGGGASGEQYYSDGERNVSFTCSDWMTVVEGGVGVNTDPVLVSDGMDGYVTVDDVTGSWDEYICWYFETFFGEFFSELYGDYDEGEWELIDLDDPNYQHLSQLEGYGEWWTAITGNFWNDDYDIQFLVVALSAPGGNLIKCVMLPYNAEESQLLSLCNEVWGFDTAS